MESARKVLSYLREKKFEFLNKILNKFLRPSKLFVRHSEVKFDDFLQIPNILLKLVLFDFRDVSDCVGEKEKRKLNAKNFLYFFCNLNVIISFSLNEVSAFSKRHDIKELTYGICLLLSFIDVYAKATLFRVNKRKIVEIMNSLRESYPTRNEIVRKTRDRFRKLSQFIASFCILFDVALIMLPLGFLFVSGIKFLFVPYPDFMYQTWIFPLTLIWSLIFTVYSISQPFALNLTSVALIKMVSLEFDVVADEIRQVKHRDEEEIQDILPHLIDRHNRALKLANTLNEIFSIEFLIRYVLSGSIIGILLFQLRTSWNLVSFLHEGVYIAYELSQIFLQCYFGQTLIDASESVADATYNCKWENWMSLKMKKSLIVMMERSQKPATLTTWKFGIVSRKQFTVVLDSIYNLMSFIMVMHGK